MTTKLTCFLFCCILALGVAAPALAWQLNDSEEPGSVLVFPKFEVGTRFTPDQGEVPRTTFLLSVTCPKGSTCDKTGNFDTGQKVHLKANWVCPPNKEIAGDTTCRANDFPLETTVFGTLVFNIENIQPMNFKITAAPPCDEEGYLIVWVVDEAGRAIKFDGLIGHEVHRDFDTTAHSLVALPIQAAEWLNTGDLTDGNSDGNLAFDGNEYKSITGTVFGDLRYDSDDGGNPTIETGITLLTLDVKANVPNDPTDVGLNFFGEREQYSSTAASFTCWKEVEAAELDSGLVASNPVWTERGHLESTYATQKGLPATVVGFIETKEGFTQEIDVPSLPVQLCGLVTIPVPQVCHTILGITLCTTPNPVTQSVCFNGNAFPNPVSVPGNRQYAYPLLNDSEPVSTTYETQPPPQPPPD